ncbi:MAG: glucoamylase family protein, partial [Verrucomicrobiota bacterium]
RGWIDHETALQQCRETTRFALEKVSHEHGFFYHFLDLKKGTPAWECEASPIDTALFLSGAMCAREYFNDPELTELVNTIRDRVDWQWMLNGGKNLALGWTPKEGFLPYRWDNYSEHMVMDLMGIGAVTKSLPTETWGAWKRTPVGTHDGMTFMESPPLFTHQYSQAFVDFREKTDGRLDYFLNSRYATLAQRSMCIAMQKTFPEWGENVWGITASDSAHGYIAWGGPPLTGPLDGTIVPCAPGGSIPFAPEECLSALREMKKRWGEKIWGRYGFADAFNPHNGWVDSDVIGIDVGITLLQAENYRTGLIWKTFMRSPEIKKAMEAVGFGPSQELMAHSSFVKYETLAH